MSSTAETPGPSPIDRNEPEAAQLRKAGEGAFWYALRNAGWTDVQIHNSLQSHRESIAHELAEQIRSVGVDIPAGMSEIGRAIRWARDDVADLIDPEIENP